MFYYIDVVVEMNIIRRKRKELGISQKELSEKLGTSQQTISRIEKADIENIADCLMGNCFITCDY